MGNRKIKTTTTTVTTVSEDVENSNEKTHIICILDRSGSMSTIISDSIGGFNTFLDKQKELPDDATITVVLFDDKYELLYDNIDIKKTEKITDKIWIPRGTTALYDAVCKTINTEKANFIKMGFDAPSKVLVCIVSDGQENASKEYTNADIKKLIKECEKDDWNFIYLAANQDAFSVGTSFGISGGNTYTYSADSLGVNKMSATLNNASTTYRSASVTSSNFSKLSKNLISIKDDSSISLNYTSNSINDDDNE